MERVELMRRLRRLTIAGLCFCAFPGGSTSTSQAENQPGCWPAEELAGKPEEKKIGHVPYDPSIEPKGDAVTLPSIPEAMRGSIRGVKLPHGEKLVALTFDLCENPGEISGYDSEIVDTLRRANVKATFFPSGKWLLDHRVRAEQLLADPLFQVGAHSWTHRNFRLLKEDDVKADLALDLLADAGTRRSLRARACYQPGSPDTGAGSLTLFRFPFGTCSAESLKAVNDAGLLAIQWDLPSGDPARAQSAEAIRKGVAASAKPGSIIVMHANGRGWHTAEALPLLIEDLRNRGFEFATVGEMLAKGEPIIADSCYELKPGDNARYDKLFPVEKPAKAEAPAADWSPAVVKPSE
jgi:peptidoglycan/xylan/chitin deacetylase (PgdA/CDA1 family)